jgi:hypothetical protein
MEPTIEAETQIAQQNQAVYEQFIAYGIDKLVAEVYATKLKQVS